MFYIANHRSNVYKFLAINLFNPAEKIFKEKSVILKQAQNSLNELEKTFYFKSIKCLNQLLNEKIDDSNLRIEYTKLFITSYPKVPCPPYESVYRTEDKLTMRKSTLDVLRFYNRFKLNLSEKFKEPPDHVAVEVEFMYFLTLMEAEAWKNGSHVEAYKYLEAEDEFMSKHLATWVSDFCQCVEKNGKIIFYKAVACVLERFVKMDLKFIQSTLKKRENFFKPEFYK